MFFVGETPTLANCDVALPGQGERAAMLPYTICFCRRGDVVLMLHRARPPVAHRWNGVGGKIEPGETPLTCVWREVEEETGLDLHAAERVRFAGLVRWGPGGDIGHGIGMYVFIADFSAEYPIWGDERLVPEGRLSWKPLLWVCDPTNMAVVDNIPHFLPAMLARTVPLEYRCDYSDGSLLRVTARPLRILVRAAIERV